MTCRSRERVGGVMEVQPQVCGPCLELGCWILDEAESANLEPGKGSETGSRHCHGHVVMNSFG